MSVYARFKRNPNGLRNLVELWETTPIERRKRMIEVGMAEDPRYTEMALAFVMTFQDVLNLQDMELAELISITPVRMVGLAIGGADEAVRERFIRCAKPPVAAVIRELLESKFGPREIGGAQLKMVEKLRELERKGAVTVKRIPI